MSPAQSASWAIRRMVTPARFHPPFREDELHHSRLKDEQQDKESEQLGKDLSGQCDAPAGQTPALLSACAGTLSRSSKLESDSLRHAPF